MMFSINATWSKGLGRMVNDGTGAQHNCKMEVVPAKSSKDQPKLCLFATRDIEPDTELRFDYGVTDLPWRKVCILYNLGIISKHVPVF